MMDWSRSLPLPSLRALAVGVVLVGLPPDLAASEEPGSRSPEIVLLGDQGPKRVVLEVEVDGKSLLASWDEAIAALLRHCDRDGDATLNETEARGLPAPFGIRQLSWGVFRLDGPAPQWHQVDADGNAKVNTAELSAFYRSKGLGPVLVGVGQPRFTDRLNLALVAALDADRDGRVSAGEVRNAGAILGTRDRNGDERLTAEELVADISYPGTRGTSRLAPPPSANAAEFPLVVLPSWDDGGRWAEAVARRPGFPLDAGQLRSWRDEAPADRWAIRLGRPPDDSPAPTRPGPSRVLAPGEWLTADATGLAWHLRADEGTQAAGLRANRKQLTSLFTAADLDFDGRVTAKDLEDPSRTLLALVLPWADRDGDGDLSQTELEAWSELLDTLTRGTVLITVLDHGKGFFEVIDSDHDGSLSPRELRSSGEPLAKAGALVDGLLEPDRLPRTLIGCVSRGHPRTAVAARPSSQLDWFQGMDRNRDGDVSALEWVGDRSLFHDLDVDHDGLLSPREAMR